jgi:hypothetical protein
MTDLRGKRVREKRGPGVRTSRIAERGPTEPTARLRERTESNFNSQSPKANALRMHTQIVGLLAIGYSKRAASESPRLSSKQRANRLVERSAAEQVEPFESAEGQR